MNIKELKDKIQYYESIQRHIRNAKSLLELVLNEKEFVTGSLLLNGSMNIEVISFPKELATYLRSVIEKCEVNKIETEMFLREKGII